jgi:hypothetical protein
VPAGWLDGVEVRIQPFEHEGEGDRMSEGRFVCGACSAESCAPPRPCGCPAAVGACGGGLSLVVQNHSLHQAKPRWGRVAGGQQRRHSSTRLPKRSSVESAADRRKIELARVGQGVVCHQVTTCVGTAVVTRPR